MSNFVPPSIGPNARQGALADAQPEWRTALVREFRRRRILYMLLLALVFLSVTAQITAFVLFVRWGLPAVQAMLHPQPQESAAPPAVAGKSQPGLKDSEGLVQVCEGQPTTSGRLTIRYITGDASFAALYFDVTGSREDHYLQMPIGWEDDVDIYSIALDHTGVTNSGGESTVNCAWLEITKAH